MAKTPKAGAAGNDETPKAGAAGDVFVLTRNFGWIEGRDHRFLEAGTELSVADDGDLIADLHRLGASIEPLK